MSTSKSVYRDDKKKKKKPLELSSTEQEFNPVSHPSKDRESTAMITADGSLTVVRVDVHDVRSGEGKWRDEFAEWHVA